MNKKTLAVIAAFMLATCTSQPGEPAPEPPSVNRELLAAQLREGLKIARTVPETAPYVDAVEALLIAYVEREEMDWSALFAAIREQESTFHAALLEAGWDKMRAQSAISVTNMILLQIESQLAAQPPPQEDDGAEGSAIARPAIVVRDLPEFSPLREVTTVYEDGGWHFLNGVRRDNIGDFTMGIVLVGDRRFYVLMARMGTPPPGGAFWWVPYDHPGAPYEGWRQGAESWGEVWEPPIKSLPRPGSQNIDTHSFVQNPLTQVLSWWHCVKQRGVSHLERATSTAIDPAPAAYSRWFEAMTSPDTQEQSIVIDPWAATAYLFVVEKTTEAPDDVGVRFRSKVYRSEIPLLPLAQFDLDPQLGPLELVFAPGKDGQGGWGTANTVLQPGVCILPDRTYLMAALGKRPISIPGTNPPRPAVGQMNRTTAVGLWRSSDRGATWIPEPGNPVFDREYLGLTDGLGNQVNSPHPWLDPWKRIVYVAMQLNREGEVNQVGSRIVMCEARL